MRKVSKHINQYLFEDIDEFIEKVDIDKLREEKLIDYPQYDWTEPIKQDFETILSYFGFYDIELCWDLSYSQGSGASFTAKWDRESFNIKELKEYTKNDKDIHKIAEWLKDLISESTKECECFEYGELEECGYLREYYKNKKECEEGMILSYAEIIRANNHYCHEYTIEAECYDADGNRRIDLDYDFTQIAQELAKWFYDKLEIELDYLTSDKGIAEYFVYNGILIDEKYIKEEYKNESTTNNTKDS